MAQRGLEVGVTGKTQIIQSSPAKEGKEVPQNNFLIFIDEKRELFTNLSMGVRRLREEEQSWRSSPRFVALFDEFVEIIRVGSPRTFDPKKEQEFRRRYTDALFNNTESPLGEDETIQFRRKLLPPYRARLDEWEKTMSQFERDYQAVRKPIREVTLETRQALLAQFEEYLRADFAHLFDFRDFLADPKLASMREQIRPFLASLAEHVFKTREKDGNMLTQLRREWTERTKDIINEVDLRFFLLSPDKGIGPKFFELIKFAVELMRPDENINDEDILHTFEKAPLTIWPEDVRMGYQKCSAARIASVIDGIRKGLEPYRR